MRGLGFLIILASIAMTVFLGGDFGYFLDVPSLILVLGVTIGGIIMRHGVAGFSQLLDVEHNQDVAQTMGDAALMGALIATPIAAVYLLSNYDGPKIVGPALAVSMLGAAYGIILYAVSYVISPKSIVKTGSAILLVATAMMSMTFYAIIFAAFLPGTPGAS